MEKRELILLNGNEFYDAIATIMGIIQKKQYSVTHYYAKKEKVKESGKQIEKGYLYYEIMEGSMPYCVCEKKKISHPVLIHKKVVTKKGKLKKDESYDEKRIALKDVIKNISPTYEEYPLLEQLMKKLKENYTGECIITKQEVLCIMKKICGEIINPEQFDSSAKEYDFNYNETYQRRLTQHKTILSEAKIFNK